MVAIDEILRVNHAGELGARQIYLGQMAVLGRTKELEEMYQQEQTHLDFFHEALLSTGTRPSLLTPVWHAGGFALGALSACLGEKAAMAATVAIEEVIAEHYQEQIEHLTGTPHQDLQATLVRFRQDEIEHQDIALEHGAEQAPAYRLFTTGIKAISKLAIAIAKKI